jgi:peptide/nickel transport system permease protein
MIRFILGRLLTVIPTVFGISLATFVLINIAIGTSAFINFDERSMDSVDRDEMGRAYGLHLPLFINFSIEDVKTRTQNDVRNLSDPALRNISIRSIVRTGGAALPYVLPLLSSLDKNSQNALLQALDKISISIGMKKNLDNASDKISFWIRYLNIYGSDYSTVRTARLVERYATKNDTLALAELKQLHTYALPELMAILNKEISFRAKARVVNLLCILTKRKDPLSAYSSKAHATAVINRWNEWWNQRYDLYTRFEGIKRITGTITETRYFKWLSRVIMFDFGVSTRDGQSIRKKIMKRLPVTLLLSALALLTAYLIAIPLGVVSAVKHGTLFDKTVSAATFIVYALPAFWVAIILLKYFGSTGYLNWFPSQGLKSDINMYNWPWWKQSLDMMHHLALPVLCLSFVSIAMLTRYQRVGMIRVTEQKFIRTARAKGLSEFKIVIRHGLRNGVIPLITLMGLQLPYLISGSVVIERIFGIQGMGLETFEAIRASDYFWLMAVVTVTAVLTMLGILASDVIYALVDPRIVPGQRFWRRL